MKRFDWTKLSEQEKRDALARPEGLNDATLEKSVKAILDTVKISGDKAIRDYTAQFDGVQTDALEIPRQAFKAAWDALPASDQAVIDQAIANIKAFHEAQIPAPIRVETMPGVICERVTRPIQTVGLYVPGGTAPLISTLLMLAVPAKIANVPNRIVVTPPSQDGTVNPIILAAAYRCDVSALYICGGAQAIAGLAYGTDTLPRCDKIFGPGNAYVAAAKSMVAQEAGGPAIDMPAGPSEAMVVADKDANPDFVAADLLSQAEHDQLAQVICVCDNPETAALVEEAVNRQLTSLPRRDIAQTSLGFARFFVSSSQADQLDIINRYGPEHLILQIKDPESLVGQINNAGSIFLGPWTPESVGDYASGTNHTLPTYGATRAYSGITLESFLKYVSVQKLTRMGLEALGPTVERLADMEGLEAHRRAVSIRLESQQEN